MARLIARAHGQMLSARPRLPSRFEPARQPEIGPVVPPLSSATEATTPEPTIDGVVSAPPPARPVATAQRGASTERSAMDGFAPPRPAALVQESADQAAQISSQHEFAAASVSPAQTQPPIASTSLSEAKSPIASSTPAPVLAPRSPDPPGLATPTGPMEAITRPAAPVGRGAAAFRPPPPSRQAQHATNTNEEFVVQVTIGRVDVRAIMPDPPKPPRKATQPGRSLDDYLAQARQR